MAVFFARIVMPRSRSRSFEIHHALDHLLILSEDARLPQQAVYQCCLAVVDVCNNCDISKIFSFRHK